MNKTKVPAPFVPWMPDYSKENYRKFERKVKRVIEMYWRVVRKAGIKV